MCKKRCNILCYFQKETCPSRIQTILVEIPILNIILNLWGFQFVLVETPIGVSTRFKPVEIPIGICPSRDSNWSLY